MNAVGKAISLFCHLGGWFFPMYGAARLEAQNIREYELAARLAWGGEAPAMVEPLLEMAELEWDHELYFRTQAAKGFLWPFMPKWRLPSLRSDIRASFHVFAMTQRWTLPAVRGSLLVR